jgi:hypothetical protein
MESKRKFKRRRNRRKSKPKAPERRDIKAADTESGSDPEDGGVLLSDFHYLEVVLNPYRDFSDSASTGETVAQGILPAELDGWHTANLLLESR